MSKENVLEIRTITIRDRTFEVHELSYGALNKLTATLNPQDSAQAEQARGAFGANLIAATCTENGEAITFDQASGFGARIGKKLETEAMSLNGFTEEAKAQAKN